MSASSLFEWRFSLQGICYQVLGMRVLGVVVEIILSSRLLAEYLDNCHKWYHILVIKGLDMLYLLHSTSVQLGGEKHGLFSLSALTKMNEDEKLMPISFKEIFKC